MLRFALISFILGLHFFSFAQPSNDSFSNAIDITALINGCSTDAEFTTNNATSDMNSGSCWNNSGPQLNVWFSFTAPSENISITVDRGGIKGSQQRSQVTLWESNGTTEVSCSRYKFNGDDVVLDAVGTLIPGNTYYLSVDTYSSSFRGSFTLCLSESISYDYFEGALDVSHLINNCSEDAIYSTIGGSPDRSLTSCWNNTGPKFNRWFSFIATSTSISAKVDIGGDQGSQQRTQVALWTSGGVEIGCKRYTLNGEDVVLDALESLTIGEKYYMSVDSFSESFVGTFSLCLDDKVSYDYFEGAIDVTFLIGRCSADQLYSTIGGSPDGLPGSCWNNSGPQFNRWFSFVANSTSMKATIDIGGEKGNQQRTQATLWQSDGTTEVACDRYVLNADDVVVESVDGLTIGNTYYLSVDTYNSNFDGTFTLCLDNGVSYDFQNGAYIISDINNWCSNDSEFSTLGATSDLNAGSCWGNSTPLVNRWFAFEATGASISVTVDIEGSKGSQRQTEIALWESDGTTQLVCKHYQQSNEDVVLEANGILTPGSTYYVSVDTELIGSAGTFSMCVDDEVSYDYLEGAVEITNLNNWCSSDAEFTTIGATPDRNPGSCWDNGGPQFNRWFYFTAIGSIVDIVVDVEGVKGTQQNTQLSLWESDGITEIDCGLYSSANDDVDISFSGLTVGNTYYISVDVRDESSSGTFTMCVSNIDQTFYSIGDGTWTDPSKWSLTSHSGTNSAFYPQVGDVVNIKGDELVLNSAESVAEVNLFSDATNTSLLIDGVTLSVKGEFNLTNNGDDLESSLTLTNNAILDIQDDFTISKSDGEGALSVDQFQNSSINFYKNLILFSNGGTINGIQLTLNNTSNLFVEEQTHLSAIAGEAIKLTLNDDAVFSCSENINIQADGVDLVEIELNNNGIVNLGASITRGAPAYGILDCNDNSTVVFNSSNNLQTWPANEGESSDLFEYKNVQINNSRVTFPQVTLEGDVDISGTLSLTDGIVNTTSSALLTLTAGSSIVGGDGNSFIDGPLRMVGNSAVEFPIGEGDFWAPIGISSLVGADASTSITAEYIGSRFTDDDLANPDPSGEQLEYVSILEHWNVDVSGNLTSANVTLHWKDASSSEIREYDDLRMANYLEVATEWRNLGFDAIDSNDPGSITVDDVTNFGSFTFGTISRGNPLPVELAYARVKSENNKDVLEWGTYSEVNNKKFTIERSFDGIDFEFLGSVVGKGTTSKFNGYSYEIFNNYFKSVFYRLSQIDFDGKNEILKIIFIEDNSSNFLHPLIYPNPSETNIGIDFSSFFGEISIEIFDLSGSLIHSEKVNKDSNDYKLELNLDKGSYLIRVSDLTKERSQLFYSK